MSDAAGRAWLRRLEADPGALDEELLERLAALVVGALDDEGRVELARKAYASTRGGGWELDDDDEVEPTQIALAGNVASETFDLFGTFRRPHVCAGKRQRADGVEVCGACASAYALRAARRAGYRWLGGIRNGLAGVYAALDSDVPGARPGPFGPAVYLGSDGLATVDAGAGGTFLGYAVGTPAPTDGAVRVRLGRGDLVELELAQPTTTEGEPDDDNQ